jgi:hypothetical protein
VCEGLIDGEVGGGRTVAFSRGEGSIGWLMVVNRSNRNGSNSAVVPSVVVARRRCHRIQPRRNPSSEQCLQELRPLGLKQGGRLEFLASRGWRFMLGGVDVPDNGTNY